MEIATGSPEPWPKSGTSDVAVGLLGGERFLAAIEPWHGNEVVVYQGSGQSWKRTVIDDRLSDAHTVETVAGFRGKPYGVYIYRFRGAKWNREVLDAGRVQEQPIARSVLVITQKVHTEKPVAHSFDLYRKQK